MNVRITSSRGFGLLSAYYENKFTSCAFNGRARGGERSTLASVFTGSCAGVGTGYTLGVATYRWLWNQGDQQLITTLANSIHSLTEEV